MVTLIAGTAGLLGIFSCGAQISRRTQEAEPDLSGLQPTKQLSDWPVEPRATAAEPIDAGLHRAPSVLDVIESKWFGSVESSNPSSHFHDSAASVSPPQRRRQPTGAEAQALDGRGAPPQTAARPQSQQGSSSGGSHFSSASRRIDVSANGSSAHWNGTAPVRPLPTAPPPTSESAPDTPEWMDRSSLAGDLSVIDSSGAPTPLARAASSGDADADADVEDLTQRGGGAAAAAMRARQQSQPDSVPEAKPVTELFGTWARRQKHFPRKAEAESTRPSTDTAGNDTGIGSDDSAAGTGGAAEQRQRQRAAPVLAPHQRMRDAVAARHTRTTSSGDDDDKAKEHAWRWRFGRRWAAEQAKQWDPDYGKQAGDEDGWDEALGYLDACGGGLHLQIGRTVSIDKTLGKASLHRDGSASFMLESDSLQEEGTLSQSSSDYHATRSLGAVARKAQELLKRQRQIDQDVSRQWGDTRAAGASWAGQFMPAVTIDMHGRFPFVLLRAADRSGMHKLLVRGKAGSTQAQLLQAAKQEAAQQAYQRQVPTAAVDIIGSGTMTWSRERDRCIDVSDGRVVKGSDTVVRTHADAGRLAGALTSCSLPMSYRVTVDGARMM